MIYLQLFFSFLQVGMFSFGGGYAAMPLIQGQVVTAHKWLSMSEFTDLITISQMTPGPIAVNSNLRLLESRLREFQVLWWQPLDASYHPVLLLQLLRNCI